jgi:hypothetical protein
MIDLFNEMAVAVMEKVNVEFVSTVVIPVLSGLLN